MTEVKGQKNLWIGIRALDKTTFPGKLDMTVAGGVTAGLTLKEVLEKEAEEEASIQEKVSKNSIFLKRARYCWHTPFYIKRECVFIYDLNLTGHPSPSPNDLETTSFKLEPLDSKIFCEPEKWKPNCLAISLDFCKRNGQTVQSEILNDLISSKCSLF